MKTQAHELKIYPEQFDAVVRGELRHQVRLDDRAYAVGDALLLRKYDGPLNGYTGGALLTLVKFKTPGGVFGLPTELCVLSISPPAIVIDGWRYEPLKPNDENEDPIELQTPEGWRVFPFDGLRPGDIWRRRREPEYKWLTETYPQERDGQTMIQACPVGDSESDAG